MTERNVEPSSEAAQNIGLWAFRNNLIYITPPLEAKTVRVTFRRSIISIADESTVAEIRKGKNFLAFRTAALCAEFAGGNAEIANSLNTQAQIHLDKLMSVLVKNQQGVRVRRKPFRISRFTTFTSR